MPVPAVVIHDFDRVQLRVNPVNHVILSEVDGQGLGVADVRGHDGPPLGAVHPGGLDLGVVAGVGPVHEAVLGVDRDRGRPLEAGPDQADLVPAIILGHVDGANRDH